jgi:hypothetical protein
VQDILLSLQLGALGVSRGHGTPEER